MLRGLFGLVAAVVVLMPAGAHAAADTVITFNDLAQGTEITDQYKAQGLTFARGPDGPSGTPPTIVGAGADRDAMAYNACGGEFCNFGSHFIAAKVDFARQKVKVTITDDGYSGLPNGCYGPTTLTAMTGNGTVIDTATEPDGATAPFDLQVDSTSQNIQFIELCGLTTVDDVTYDNPDTPPPADFNIVGQYDQFAGPDSVNVVTTQSAAFKVFFNRFNLSTGNIQLALSGLPAGVSAAGFPKTVNPPDGSTTNVSLTATKDVAPGSYPITVTATPQSSSAGPAARTLTFTLHVLAQSDLRVSGIEVTQGMQTQLQGCSSAATCASVASLPFRDTANPTNPVNYVGVPLVAHRKTFARVFANRRFPQTGAASTGATITLRGFRDGKQVAGSPLTAPAPPLPPGQNFVTLPERTQKALPALFVLPDAWTAKGGLTLEAEVTPELAFIGSAGATDCTTSECVANNKLRMTGIGFDDTGYLDIATARLWVPGENLAANGVTVPCCFESNEGLQKFYPDPEDVLRYPEAVLPLREGGFDYDPHSYYASINAAEVLEEDKEDRTDEALDLLDDYSDDYPGCESRNFCADQIIGFYGDELSTAGLSHGDAEDSDHSSVANYGRPDSATHELSHGHGRVHASTGCGGNSDGQEGELWPPDERGYMDGIGYDRRNGNVYAQRSLGAFGSGAGANGPGDPLNFTFQPNLWFDYESYCRTKEGADAGIWTSARGWTKNYNLLREVADELDRLRRARRVRSVPAPYVAGAARAAQAAGLLRVRGTIHADNTAEFDSIKPRSGTATTGPADSAFTAVVRGADGGVLSQTPMAAESKHIEGTDGTVTVSTAVLADVPAAGAQSIELTRAGSVLATFSRSAARPVVKVLAPKAKARVGTKRLTAVRWKATDADGDRLGIKIDYSTDAGKTFLPIYLGPNTGSTTIPSTLFAGSRRARVRIRANDGFNETAALSGIFTAVGNKPSVAISSPEPKQRVRADESLVLIGRAYDDRRRLIPGKRMTWFEGKRKLGRGRSVTVIGLRAGKRKIRLVATAGGRRGTASVPIRVAAVVPHFLAVTAPESVPAAATSFPLTVRASVPATLRIGSQRFKVGRKARKVSVKVPAGSAALALTLKLIAGDLSNSSVLTLPRS